MTYAQRYIGMVEEIHRGIEFCRGRLNDVPVLLTLGDKQLRAIQVVMKEKGKRKKA